MHTETVPHHQHNAEIAHNRASALHLGSAILQSEVPRNEIEQGLEMLNAHANGADIRPEDKGRIHDAEVALEAALKEDDLVNAHTEALRENEMFDAHAQALLENEMFDLYTEAEKEDKRRTTLTQVSEPQDTPPNAAVEQKKEDKVDPEDMRNQAQVALKEAGYKETLPANSQVRKDFETGNLLIVTDKDVKVVERLPGGHSRVTEYDFSEDANILTIRTHGADTITAQVGEYVPMDKEAKPGEAIKLPPAIARILGFNKATKIQ